MKKPDRSVPIPESDPASVATAVEEAGDEAEEVEAWTPERVTYWNAYYDLYVMLGVLLLAFIASSNRITHSSIWNQLQVGRMIAAGSAPVTTDLFSYTEAGRPWVNIPWLFDLVHAMV